MTLELGARNGTTSQRVADHLHGHTPWFAGLSAQARSFVPPFKPAVIGENSRQSAAGGLVDFGHNGLLVFESSATGFLLAIAAVQSILGRS